MVRVFELLGSFPCTEDWGIQDSALAVEVGEHVVFDEWDELGWAKATSLRDGRRGWLPLNFSRLHVAHSVWAWFRTQWLPAKLQSVDVQGDSVQVTWETVLEGCWNGIGIVLELYWNATGMALECHWNAIGIVLEWHWNCIVL